jgi:hypothetical protein
MHPLVKLILVLVFCEIIRTIADVWHIHDMRRAGSQPKYWLAIVPKLLATVLAVFYTARWLGWLAIIVAICDTSAFAQTGSVKTQSALTTEINTNFPDNTTGLITPQIMRQTTLDMNVSAGNLATTDMTLSGGANVTSNNLGTISSGTTTVDCGLGPLQYFTDNGAFTLAAPSNDGSCIVLDTNGASAGTITFSGFSVGANTGDAIDTTNGHKFSISIWRINGTSGYSISAHQ